jgi:hypothetical protein
MARLTTAMLVAAVMAEANREMVSVVLSHRGDAARGTIFVRLEGKNGQARVEGRHHDPAKGYVWAALHAEDWIDSPAAEAILEKQISYDQDCWVINVDSPEGVNPFVHHEG